MKRILLASSLVFMSIGGWARAEAPQPSELSDAPTLMTERGRLLFADELDTEPGPAWKVAKGTWTAADGSLRGEELEADHHGAVMRHALPFRDVVIQYDFRLDGTRATTLSINTAKAHLCRVSINAAGFQVRKDDFDHDGPDKAVLFQAVRTPIEAGAWHTLVVELCGDEMLARLDGRQVGYGRSEALGVDKANLGLTVAGASASFRDLRVWEAHPKAGWEQTRAKVLESQPASASK